MHSSGTLRCPAPRIYHSINIKLPAPPQTPCNHHAQKEHAPLNTFQELIKPIKMLEKLKSFYTDPLYLNSLALMLNSAFGAFFGLLFRIVAARGMLAKGLGIAARRGRRGSVQGGEVGLT
ncbi:MAG: hypothetical protein O8C67_06820 [Candidatus Methanoperedens sp.]|nr:hypothetical protein [Candidatus Methanoperedens sp.]